MPGEPSVTLVDERLVRQVAQLARLELSAAEASQFTEQLRGIVGYVEKLQQADVSGVEPMLHPLELATPLRDDVVQASPLDAEGRPKVLQSAPEVLHDGFKVPPIL